MSDIAVGAVLGTWEGLLVIDTAESGSQISDELAEFLTCELPSFDTCPVCCDAPATHSFNDRPCCRGCLPYDPFED